MMLESKEADGFAMPTIKEAPGTGSPDEDALVASDLARARAEIAELKERVAFMEWQALSLSTFAKALGSAHLILFSMDPSGVTTMSDGRGLALLGQKPGERVGRNELEGTRGTPAHDYLRRALAG